MKKKNHEFTSSPFKSLKGLSLQVKEEVKADLPPKKAEVIREYDFVAEMKGLGVKAISPDNRLASPASPPSAPLVSVSKPICSEPASDEELFLSALEGIEVIFHDEIPELEVPHATPRRLKLVKLGRLKPADRLDLHGFTRGEARRRAEYFLENAVHHGYQLVLIVTGWGKNSSGEAVLREEISRYLRTDGAPLVSEWSFAPRSLGGDGAFLVFLKGRKKNE